MRRLPTTSSDRMRVSGGQRVTRHRVIHLTEIDRTKTHLIITDPTIDAEIPERRRP